MYRLLFDLLLRRLDPETAHHLGFRLIRLASATGLLRALARRRTGRQRGEDVPAPVHAFGRRLSGCFGLAAGFDKNAVGVQALTELGFAFVEVGTVTARPQPGNDRPRLWRIPEMGALRNRMGFNNEGAAAVAARLRVLRSTPRGRALVVGANLGKSKVTPALDAPADYATSAGLLAPWADYLVVNVSSPNTPGLRSLQAVDQLRPIVQAVRRAADAVTAPGRVPLLVKIAPDLSDDDVDAVADLARELALDGVVAVNTTIAHDLGEGGLSGPPVRARGVAVVRRLRDRLGAIPTIIGVGGIASARDAQAYLEAGADLVQAYTGFIYGGPFWPARINRALSGSQGGRP